MGGVAAESEGEGPFTGGVFDREVGSPYERPPEARYEPKVARRFDGDERSNEVIILFDTDDEVALTEALAADSAPESRKAGEEALVQAVRDDNRETQAFFAGALDAFHAIAAGRLDAHTRAGLGREGPRERLERYIVLRYATIEEAEQTAGTMRERRGIEYAALNGRVRMLAAPNDPYFAVSPQGPTHYQWGMHAMNFPNAWDVTMGHGYVAALDLGVEDQQAPPDIAGGSGMIGNYRPQFSVEMPNAYTYPSADGTSPMCRPSNSPIEAQ